jgi:hypothetical protein
MMLNMNRDPLSQEFRHELASVPDIEEAADYWEILNNQDDDLMGYLENEFAVPTYKIMDFIGPISSTFEEVVDYKTSEEIRDMAKDEQTTWLNAVLAGRSTVEAFDNSAVAGRVYINGLVHYLIENHFNNDPNSFDINAIDAQSYNAHITDLGGELIDDSEVRLKFGAVEGDQAVIRFLTSINFITTLAVASGSRKCVLKAKEILVNFANKKLTDDVVRGESNNLLRIVVEIHEGKKEPQALIDYKDALGDDWEETAEYYCVNAVLDACLQLLEDLMPAKKSKSFAETQKIAQATRKHLTLNHVANILEEREMELKPAEPQEHEEVRNPQFMSRLFVIIKTHLKGRKL